MSSKSSKITIKRAFGVNNAAGPAQAPKDSSNEISDKENVALPTSDATSVLETKSDDLKKSNALYDDASSQPGPSTGPQSQSSAIMESSAGSSTKRKNKKRKAPDDEYTLDGKIKKPRTSTEQAFSVPNPQSGEEGIQSSLNIPLADSLGPASAASTILSGKDASASSGVPKPRAGAPNQGSDEENFYESDRRDSADDRDKIPLVLAVELAEEAQGTPEAAPVPAIQVGSELASDLTELEPPPLETFPADSDPTALIVGHSVDDPSVMVIPGLADAEGPGLPQPEAMGYESWEDYSETVDLVWQSIFGNVEFDLQVAPPSPETPQPEVAGPSSSKRRRRPRAAGPGKSTQKKSSGQLAKERMVWKEYLSSQAPNMDDLLAPGVPYPDFSFSAEEEKSFLELVAKKEYLAAFQMLPEEQKMVQLDIPEQIAAYRAVHPQPHGVKGTQPRLWVCRAVVCIGKKSGKIQRVKKVCQAQGSGDNVDRHWRRTHLGLDKQAD